MLKNIFTKNKSHKSNLGSTLERDINLTNIFYQNNKIALIFKNEIPIKVVKVDYSSRQRTKIIEAYYCSTSLPDYQGLYKGRYLCFEVKETNNKNSFPFSNIPKHQLNNLKLIQELKGIAFFIINFKVRKKYFYLPIEFLIDYINNSRKQSINYKICEEKLYQIPLAFYPRLNYLKIVDNFL
ncbi:MAG: Holliday junction resolvase RecU [Phytoplasma sp.]|uniref:Holliday junction resolvase RecU n=1 Tax=Phytoplasma sp. TaxID=2155 RepID=UPI002B41242E|nr:Holliday junction resolvase RecU [Phytoplasma sp.]WRH06773.1 MAG: Holliday junction resolvase RecU [Phytoplasma sp.]